MSSEIHIVAIRNANRLRCKHLVLTLVVHAIFAQQHIFVFFIFKNFKVILHLFSSTTTAESNLVFR